MRPIVAFSVDDVQLRLGEWARGQRDDDDACPPLTDAPASTLPYSFHPKQSIVSAIGAIKNKQNHGGSSFSLRLLLPTLLNASIWIAGTCFAVLKKKEALYFMELAFMLSTIGTFYAHPSPLHKQVHVHLITSAQYLS